MEFEVNKRGTLTIPSEIRDEYQIEPGDKIRMGLLDVDYKGETQVQRNWRKRDKMTRAQHQEFLQEALYEHDDEDKAYRKAYERLEEEYFSDEQ